MEVFENLIKKLTDFKESLHSVSLEAVKDNENIVLDFVTEDQLFERGIDSKENKLIDREPYSPVTISIKRAKGQPTARVTLRDTSDFHESFFIKYTHDSFEISARDWKTQDLKDRYGPEIMGLTDENLRDVLVNYVLPYLLLRFKQIL